MPETQLLRNTDFATNDGLGNPDSFDGWLVVPNVNLKLVQVVGTPAGGRLDRANQLCGPDNYRPYPNATVVASLDPTSTVFNFDESSRQAIIRIQIGSERYLKTDNPTTQPNILAEWRATGFASPDFSNVAVQATIPADYDRDTDEPVYVVYWIDSGSGGTNPNWTIKAPSFLETDAGDIPESPPEPPIGLIATGKTSTTVTLGWQAVTGVAGYNVYRDGVQVNSELVTGTTFTDVALVPATQYSYSVRSVSVTDLSSVDSEPVVVTTLSSNGDGGGTVAEIAQRVADLVGASDDVNLLALAEQSVSVIQEMVRAYTRNNGFVGVEPNTQLAAVIITASARLVANPEQTLSDVGSVSVRTSFQGFNLAELYVLNRYRVRAQ